MLATAAGVVVLALILWVASGWLGGGRSYDTTRIRIAFDLTNQNQPQPLNGRVSLALIGKDGTITPVTPVAGVERDDSRFYINRYKRINTSVALPQDLQTAQVYGVRVTIEAEGQPPLVEEFPLP